MRSFESYLAGETHKAEAKSYGRYCRHQMRRKTREERKFARQLIVRMVLFSLVIVGIIALSVLHTYGVVDLGVAVL